MVHVESNHVASQAVQSSRSEAAPMPAAQALVFPEGTSQQSFMGGGGSGSNSGDGGSPNRGQTSAAPEAPQPVVFTPTAPVEAPRPAPVTRSAPAPAPATEAAAPAPTDTVHIETKLELPTTPAPAARPATPPAATAPAPAVSAAPEETAAPAPAIEVQQEVVVRAQPARVAATTASASEASSASAVGESQPEVHEDVVQPATASERRQESPTAVRQEGFFTGPQTAGPQFARQAYSGDDTPFDIGSDHTTTGDATRVAPTLSSSVKPASAQAAQGNSQSQSQDTGGFSSGDQGAGDGDQRGAEHSAAGTLSRSGPQAATGNSSALNAILAAMEPEGTEGGEEIDAKVNREISKGAGSPTNAAKVEQVASRNAASTVSTLLKKANKEKELNDVSALDEADALESLDVMLKVGGQDTERSKRVAKHAMAMADQLGINDSRTRKQIEDGAMLIDIGQAGINLASANDEQLEIIGNFLEEEGGLKMKALHAGTVLRDVGMIQVSEEVLGKTEDEMTAGELEEYRMHPVYGEQIISQIGSLKHLGPIIRGHHERWDGTGYPDGLRERDIPLASRIIAVADHFEDLMTPGPGKEPFSMEEALQTLRDGAGKQFDPNLINAFMLVMEKAT